MSSNLGLPQLTENQANPEITVNDIAAALDAVVTETFAASVASGNVSLTDAQFRLMARINITGAATSGRTVTVPAIKRSFLATAEAANSDPVALVRGSTSIALAPGDAKLCFTDGTANGLVTYTIGSTFDIAAFLPGLMVNAQLVVRLNVLRPFTLPISLTGSIVNADTAATATTTITIKKNGSSIGTLVWSAAGTVAAKTFAAAVSFAVGDVLTLEGQATADATLANVTIGLKGTR